MAGAFCYIPFIVESLPKPWRNGPRPVPSVIELLDQLQAAAKKGEIRALAVVAINPLVEVETAHAGDMDIVKKHLVIGGLFAAATKLAKED